MRWSAGSALRRSMACISPGCGRPEGQLLADSVFAVHSFYLLVGNGTLTLVEIFLKATLPLELNVSFHCDHMTSFCGFHWLCKLA